MLCCAGRVNRPYHSQLSIPVPSSELASTKNCCHSMHHSTENFPTGPEASLTEPGPPTLLTETTLKRGNTRHSRNNEANKALLVAHPEYRMHVPQPVRPLLTCPLTDRRVLRLSTRTMTLLLPPSLTRLPHGLGPSLEVLLATDTWCCTNPIATVISSQVVHTYSCD